MSIIYILIPLGMVLAGIAVGAFFWAVHSGQFDEMDSAAWRVLLDDDSRPLGTKRDTESPPAEPEA